MKLYQLIEHNMRNIFLEKSYKNMVVKYVPESFIKIKIELKSGTTV